MRILILGGTGTISLWAVRHLLAMGREVTVVNRGRSAGLPPGVEAIVADRHDRAALSAALRGRRFDATIDMLCFDAAQAETLVTALPGHGHLVFCSTVCALGFAWNAFPVGEDAVPQPTSNYGSGKAAAEAWFAGYARRSGSPLTIVRPSTTFDERIGVLRQVRWDGAAWLGRIRAGLPVVVCDSGAGLNQFMHADDAGRGFALVAGNPAAHGRTYHLVGEAVTWAHHHRTVMRVLGCEVPLVGVPGAILDRTTVPDDGIRREIFGFHGQFAGGGMLRDLGFAPGIGLEESIRRAVAGLDHDGRIPAAVAAGGWEDDLVARWG